MTSSTSCWTSPLKSAWETIYPEGPRPSHLVHAPGRVNLIGEHVDHQAYPCCPCAIKQSMGMAVSVEPRTAEKPLLVMKHIKAEHYPALTLKTPCKVKMQSEKVWTNYLCAAYLGIVEYYLNGKNAVEVGKLFNPKEGMTAEQITQAKQSPESPINFSIRVLVDGSIPIAAGLSSSAAVVVSMSMAVSYSLGVTPPTNSELATICANAERYTGVASGGMDQAAILLSQEDNCTLIRFKPLEPRCVSLPSGAALVVANTCRAAPKAKMAAKMYNKRVFELKAGCLALLSEEVRASVDAEALLNLQLRDVVREYLKSTETEILAKLPELISKKEAWSKADMDAIFGEERKQVLLTKRCGEDVWTKNEDFEVYNRVRHVLSEALRVEDFAKVCEQGDLSDEEKLVRLGELMNGSGSSLATDFDCSCPEIEEVCKIARAHGAYGSRLTGAGWGGCTISLVPESKKDGLIQAIRESYFQPIFEGSKTMEPALEDLPASIDLIQNCLFSTTPSAGAFCIEI